MRGSGCATTGDSERNPATTAPQVDTGLTGRHIVSNSRICDTLVLVTRKPKSADLTALVDRLRTDVGPDCFVVPWATVPSPKLIDRPTCR
jgi:hypothetical protein